MISIAPLPTQSVDSTPRQQIAALLEACGVAHLSHIGWIKVTGDDRVRWLNGMTTNSIQSLVSGEMNYNFFLSAQGRIQADANALTLETSILLETSADRVAFLTELLDRFIIMDDVELAEHLSCGLVVAGPQSASILAAIGIPTNDIALMHFTAMDNWRGQKIAILHSHSPLVPRFELWSESVDTIAALAEALTASGATSVDKEALNHLRILEGTPLYGTDIRDKELPQETAQTRALHFAKGCYLGQEIVERIRSRGNVHRTFCAFQLTGELPAAGAQLEADGKAVGEITSAATIPLAADPVTIALGYIRREALERNLTITYPGGTAQSAATPFLNT